MQSNSARQHHSLNVAPDAHQLICGLRVIHAHHVLFDDWTLVKVSSDIVRRRSDEFDATLVCLVIRLSALEAWEKRMMNVDHST